MPSLFKSHTDQSPIDWLTQFRIDSAKRLLVETDSSIARIAKSCGFANPAFFARAFRRRAGSSPRRFPGERTAHHDVPAALGALAP